MKKGLLIGISFLTIPAFAGYNIVISKEQNSYVNKSYWGEWENNGELFECNYIHNTDEVYLGQSFEQNGTCIEPQKRTRLDGIESETRNIIVNDTKQAIGTGIFSSCLETLNSLYFSGSSGVYTINPNNSQFDVYCDMERDGGGWTMLIGFNGTGVDLSYQDDSNVGWKQISELGSFKGNNLSYASGNEYFSKAYSNVVGNKIRITNNYDRLTWNMPSENSLKYFVNDNYHVYSAANLSDGWVFDSSSSYKVSDNYTNLSFRWGYPLKVRCTDGRSGNTDYAVLGFSSDVSHSGYYCEGFGYPNGSHAFRQNTRWYYETLNTNISVVEATWRSDSLSYNIWIR